MERTAAHAGEYVKRQSERKQQQHSDIQRLDQLAVGWISSVSQIEHDAAAESRGSERSESIGTFGS